MSFEKFTIVELQILLACICGAFVWGGIEWLFGSEPGLSSYPYMKALNVSIALYLGMNLGAAMWGLASWSYKFFDGWS